MVEQYIFLGVYGQYRWYGGEVCSNGHGGGERGCSFFFQILVSYSQFRYVVLCVCDGEHLRILSKMVDRKFY
jgi:hypothetical protein